MFDVSHLAGFVAARQQKHNGLPMPAAIHSIPGANVYPQLDNTFSDRLAVTEVSGLHLAQPNTDASLRHLVA